MRCYGKSLACDIDFIMRAQYRGVGQRNIGARIAHRDGAAEFLAVSG